MLIETVLFVVTFIISAAFSVVGIMIAYQLYQIHQKHVFQLLLYQQIFLISFFVYGIWGNIALHEILPELSLNNELKTKLTIFIPVIGIPFLVVSWFMLLRFAFLLNGFAESKSFPLIFFPVLFSVIVAFSWLIMKNVIKINVAPELFIIRVIAAINLLVHCFFMLPFLFERKNNPLVKEVRFLKKHALFYFSGVIAYSLILWFFDVFGSYSVCVSIIILFAISILIPVLFKLNEKLNISPQPSASMDFIGFCKLYEISKRESEIILEICTGKSNKAISEKLFITLQTVKDHNYRIYSKLGVKTRIQLTNLVREKTGI